MLTNFEIVIKFKLCVYLHAVIWVRVSEVSVMQVSVCDTEGIIQKSPGGFLCIPHMQRDMCVSQ